MLHIIQVLESAPHSKLPGFFPRHIQTRTASKIWPSLFSHLPTSVLEAVSASSFVCRSGLLVRVIQLRRVQIRVTLTAFTSSWSSVRISSKLRTCPANLYLLSIRLLLLLFLFFYSSSSIPLLLFLFFYSSSSIPFPIRLWGCLWGCFCPFSYISGWLVRVINVFLSIYIRVTLSTFIFLSVRFGFQATYGRYGRYWYGYVKLTYPTLLAMHT